MKEKKDIISIIKMDVQAKDLKEKINKKLLRYMEKIYDLSYLECKYYIEEDKNCSYLNDLEENDMIEKHQDDLSINKITTKKYVELTGREVSNKCNCKSCPLIKINLNLSVLFLRDAIGA